MDSTLTMVASSSFPMIKPTFSTPSFPILKQQVLFHPKSLNSSKKLMIIKASNNDSPNSSTPNPFISTLKTTAFAVILAAAVYGKFFLLPTRTIPPPPITVSQAFKSVFESLKKFTTSGYDQKLNPEAIWKLKILLRKKLKAGKNKECLEIVQKLSSSQPENTDWKFLAARLLNEMGNTQEAIELLSPVFMEEKDLPSVLTMFELSLLVDLSEFEEQMKWLADNIREALEGDVKEIPEKEAVTFIRLLNAQLQFLLNNVNEALRIYEELGREDPTDFRPFFCKGVLYTLLDRKKDARGQFAKFRQLSPKKIEVEWYLRTPIRKMSS